MASIDWPTTLPSSPLQNGFSQAQANGVLRTTIDEIAPKMRQRYTGVSTAYSCSFGLTSAQTGIMDTFYYTTTQQGTLLFNFLDPRTGFIVEARFIEPPTHRPNGPEFITSCTFEVLP